MADIIAYPPMYKQACEAEYKKVQHAACEAEYKKVLLSDFMPTSSPGYLMQEKKKEISTNLGYIFIYRKKELTLMTQSTLGRQLLDTMYQRLFL